MRSIVFDTGPIISLAINDILWILEELKKSFGGDFLVSKGIKNELIDKPLHTKRFKFEAIKVMHFLENGTISVYHDEGVSEKSNYLLDLANNCFIAHGQPIKVVHYGEISGIAIALIKRSEAFVVDERTTRLLIEDPLKLRNILRHRLHTNVALNKDMLKKFRKEVKGLNVLRSVELATVAYEMGLLDRYLTNMKEPRKELLDSVLWGIKLNGCAVSKREIEQILKVEIKG